MNITYGNREGQYFTEWRFDLLRELLEKIHLGPMPPASRVLEVEDVRIWYDAAQDFHRLSFRVGEHVVEVQFYKVFSSSIDGEEHWVGCPSNQLWEYAGSIRRKLGVMVGET